MDDGGFARRETRFDDIEICHECGFSVIGCRCNDAEEPEIDDSVNCCPDCERPNQFGELCSNCQDERAFEVADFGVRWDS